VHIAKIQIENIRCFEKVEIDLTRPDGSLAGWTVIAGRNGSGKSTLLKVLALAAVGRRAQALGIEFSGWMRGDTKKADVVLRVSETASPAFLNLTWLRATDGAEPGLFPWVMNPEVRELVLSRLAKDPSEDRVKEFFSEKSLVEIDDLIKRVIIESESAMSQGFEPFALLAYGPYRRLSGHAADAQRLMAGPPEIARVVSLFREDASLVESVSWLREVYLRRLEKNGKDAKLEKAVLALLDDGLLPDGAKVEKVDSEGLWIRQNGVSLTLRELSDGYRTVAALVLDIVRHLHGAAEELEFMKADGAESTRVQILNSAVVLIDEVDLHLHVSWQKRIGFWLKHHFPNIQFIVTTHSPFICQAADPGGLIRLPMPGEGREVEKVSEELYYTVVNGSLDEAVLSELFGLDSLYSDETDKLRDEVAALEAKVIIGKSTLADDERLQELRQKLPRTMSSDVEVVMRSLRDPK